jgi:VWFA-related protein
MKLRFQAALFFVAALPAAPLAAQSRRPAVPAGAQHARTASSSQAKPHAEEQKPLRAGVTVVRLPVSVRGPGGQLALDLRRGDFQVYDNGIQQPINHFDIGGNPISVVLVVETSARVAPLLPAIRKTGLIFTEMVMGATGEGAVIGFDDTSRLLVPFTYDHDRVQKQISRLKPGDGGSRLRDALGSAIRLLENRPENRRRAIVVLSESRDTGSKQGIGSILRDAELANVSIYTVGLSSAGSELRAAPTQASGPSYGPTGTFPTPGVPGTPQTPTTTQQSGGAGGGNVDLLSPVVLLGKMGIHLIASKPLKAASAATGGDHVSARRDRAIEQAMERFGEEINSEYILAFQAPASGPWGFHTVTVQVTRPGYKVRTRPGYFLAPPNGSTVRNP